MGFTATDIFATKGIEYLLVIGFLALLVAFWALLSAGEKPAVVQAIRARIAQGSAWFPLAAGRHYHPGHTWAALREGGVVRVGLDSFVGRLLGQPDSIEVPGTASAVRQGAPGISLRFGDRRVDLVSPVGGEVVEVNEEALRDPRRLVDDPYEGGWLLGIRVPRPQENFRSLLDGSLAAAWMADAEERLRSHMTPELGAVLQDGGLPVDGFVRHLEAEDWVELASELLRSGTVVRPGDDEPGS